MNKRVIIGILLGIIGIISITVGISYSFFYYVKDGPVSRKITFLYTEVLGIGNGISLIDSFPISDDIGKSQVREGKFFDFKIISNSIKNDAIPYEITIRKQKVSTLSDSVVKIYLTELEGIEEQEVLFNTFDQLRQTENVEEKVYIEKVIYQGEIPINEKGYERSFRLRIWIDELAEINSVDDQIFTVLVNVYANGAIVVNEEKTIN